jgi:hypothetical protein
MIDASGGSAHVGGPKAPFDEHHGTEAEDVEELVGFLVDPLLLFGPNTPNQNR